MDVNLLTDGEESSVDEILDDITLDDDFEMEQSDTTIETAMVVVKKEGEEYAPTVNALACRRFQNNGRKSGVEDFEEVGMGEVVDLSGRDRKSGVKDLEVVSTREVVDLSGRDMFPVAAAKKEMQNSEKKKAWKNARTVS